MSLPYPILIPLYVIGIPVQLMALLIGLREQLLAFVNPFFVIVVFIGGIYLFRGFRSYSKRILREVSWITVCTMATISFFVAYLVFFIAPASFSLSLLIRSSTDLLFYVTEALLYFAFMYGTLKWLASRDIASFQRIARMLTGIFFGLLVLIVVLNI